MVMNISSYQVQNILRFYTKQARLEGLNTPEKKDHTQSDIDKVSVSEEAKKKQILKEVTSQVVEQVMAKASKTESRVTTKASEMEGAR